MKLKKKLKALEIRQKYRSMEKNDPEFKRWRERALKGFKGNICVHGEIVGGPGFLGFGECRLSTHPDVRYGCAECPEHCPDFCERPDVYRIFIEKQKG